MVSIKSYKLKNNEVRFKFNVYIGVDPLTGKEKTTTRSGFKTKKEAKEALAKLRQEVRDGTFHKVAMETYQDVYELWMEQYENSVEDSTLLKTKRIFQNHILPSFGEYRIAKIDATICQKHVNQWAKKLKRFSMVKNYTALVIKYAIRHGIIDKNPFELVEMPIIKNNISLEDDDDEFENFYSREQLVQFLQCLQQDPNLKKHAVFRLLAFSGMRKGEVFALKWKDIDFDTLEIRITKAVKRGEKGLYLGATKNGKPRTIKLDQETVDLLKLWRSEQDSFFAEKKINTKTKQQLVFSNIYNVLQDPNKTFQWLLDFIKKHQLEPITTHGLRHTHCSLLFEAGASIKEVQYRLGHNDVKTTLEIYAHVTQKAKAGTIDKFTNFLKNENDDFLTKD
ncbi:site-specific integrase [Lysinibacillus fusiformis]|uniref:site-specific integrase n=1 Tax=Lysinibacillus fusiformis TaxID=28031 RepID=UPI000D3D9844|nr:MULTISPECIES: site-specific integrase [Lysinibacillus]MED4668972.1 site-specific integrase [Lysinibacillus fusiformis]QAS57281.1 site-specific integrase [Lysinibacillus sphaericus]RDV25758.1 site-specific integrase [Lysinibacillus fusiformis]GED63264.1 site-specific integrase [Lysinibacillus fusiformis]